MAEFLELASIRLDGGTQPRAAIFQDTVDAYIADMARGDPFPPMITFFDGSDYWLADGFHRYHAARALQRGGLPCEVRQGSQRDAILYSVGANHDHGRPRTDDDRRRAVQRLLADAEWRDWSDREIARHCRVSPTFVGKYRPPPVTVHVDSEPEPQARKYTDKHGNTSAMKTGNIGRKPKAPSPPTATSAPAAPTAAPTPKAVSDFRDDMAENGPIYDHMEAIKTHFCALPPAIEAASRFPPSLRHTFSPNQARHIADWLYAFAEAWENGDADVAA